MDARLPILSLLLMAFSQAAVAVDVTVSGLFPNKALVQIDAGPLTTLAVGQSTPEGVSLVAVDRDSATFMIDGRKVTLGIGKARIPASAPMPTSVSLTADLRGHFIAAGQVNRVPVEFVVDTGATYVALPAAVAKRLSIDYHKGEQTFMNTANGTTVAYRVRLDTVRVGDITLHGVDAIVIDGEGLTSPLLGMSFLNRMNMKREGDVMTLTQRY
jgi:aspartyl protease family protein